MSFGYTLIKGSHYKIQNRSLTTCVLIMFAHENKQNSCPRASQLAMAWPTHTTTYFNLSAVYGLGPNQINLKIFFSCAFIEIPFMFNSVKN